MKVVRNNEELSAVAKESEEYSFFNHINNVFLKDMEPYPRQVSYNHCIFDNCDIVVSKDVYLEGNILIRDSSLIPDSTGKNQYIQGEFGVVRFLRCDLEIRQSSFNGGEPSTYLVRKKSIFEECTIPSISVDNFVHDSDPVFLSCDIGNLVITRSTRHGIPYLYNCKIENIIIKPSVVPFSTKEISRMREVLKSCEQGIKFDTVTFDNSKIENIDFGESIFHECIFKHCMISGCNFSKIGFGLTHTRCVKFFDCEIKDDNILGEKFEFFDRDRLGSPYMTLVARRD